MNKFRKAALGLGALAAVSVTTFIPVQDASAQQLCLIRDDAIQQLGKQFGEEITARGITRDGKGMVEVLTSEQGSWTLVITDVNGRSCVISAGEAWVPVKAPRGQPS